MGFKPKRTEYRLKWSEGDLDGLQVTARSVSTGQMLELQRLGSQVSGSEADADPEALDKMMTLLAEGIVGWNVEDDDGNPLPPTRENLLDQELPFLYQILMAWTQAIAGISESLGKDSTSGSDFQEASLPMETFSPSLAS